MSNLTLEEKRAKFGVGIWTVLDFLGIEIPNRSNFYIPCQQCGDLEGRGRKTLNVNILKETFRCPRCGISGGYLDLFSLYYYGHIKSGYTKRDMLHDLRKSNFNYTQVNNNKRFSNFKIEPEIPLVEIDQRDRVYNEFLKTLTLSNNDYQDLIRRGLTPKAIKMLGYRSSTFMGQKTALSLRQKGLPLKGVPGFYRNEKTSQWDIIGIRGYYIPYRNIDGKIEGMQVRTNNPKRKYMWLSSTSKKDGSGAKAWPHFANTFSHKRKSDTFILTEGGLKGDIINFFTGIDVVAMPGVNALSQLDFLLIEMKKRGYKKVLTAFDMDFLSNQYVMKAYNDLLEFLSDKFEISVLKWDPAYGSDENNKIDTSGLDDYLFQLSKEINLFKGREYLI